MQKDTDIDPGPISFTDKQKNKPKKQVYSSELFIIATVSFPHSFFPCTSCQGCCYLRDSVDNCLRQKMSEGSKKCAHISVGPYHTLAC